MSKKCELLSAVERSAADEVASLIQKKVNANILNKEGWPILVSAAEKNQLEIVEKILGSKKINIDIAYQGMTALYLACFHGNDVMVDLLLQKNANMECAKDSDGATPLCAACFHGHLKIAKKLVDKGASIEKPMRDGCTPLYVAVKRQQVEVVEYLLTMHVSLNVTNNQGFPLLHFVYEKGDQEMLSLLLRAEPDLTIKNKDGKNIFHIACRKGDLSMIQRLIQINPNIFKELTGKGDTALKIAYFACEYQVIQYLFWLGIDIHQKNSNQESLLHHACADGDERLFWYLVNNEADVDAIDQDGCSALVKACQNNHSNIAKLLLFYRANPNVLTNKKDGDTPLILAVRKENNDLAKMLYAYGADLKLKSINQPAVKRIVKQLNNEELINFFKKPVARETLTTEYCEMVNKIKEEFIEKYQFVNQGQLVAHVDCDKQEGLSDRAVRNEARTLINSGEGQNGVEITETIEQVETVEKVEVFSEVETVLTETHGAETIAVEPEEDLDLDLEVFPPIDLIAESQTQAVTAARQLEKGVKQADQSKIFQSLQVLERVNYLEISDPLAMVNYFLKLIDRDIPYIWLKSKIIGYLRMYTYLVFLQHKEQELKLNHSTWQRIKEVVSEEGGRYYRKGQEPNWYKFEVDMLKVVVENLLNPERNENFEKEMKQILYHGIFGLGFSVIMSGKLALQTGMGVQQGIMSGLTLCGGGMITNFSGKSDRSGVSDLKPLLNHIGELSKIIFHLSKQLTSTVKSSWYIDSMVLFNFSSLATKSEEILDQFYQLVQEQKNPGWRVLYAIVESLYNIICKAEQQEKEIKLELARLQDSGKDVDDPMFIEYTIQQSYYHSLQEKIFFGDSDNQARCGIVNYLDFCENKIIKKDQSGKVLQKIRKIVKDGDDWRVREISARCCIALYEHSNQRISQTAMELIVDRRVHEMDLRVLKTLNDPLSIVKVRRAMRMNWQKEHKKLEKGLDQYLQIINDQVGKIWQESQSMVREELREQKEILGALNQKISSLFGSEKLEYKNLLIDQENYNQQINQHCESMGKQLGVLIETVQDIKQTTYEIKEIVTDVSKDTQEIKEVVNSVFGETHEIKLITDEIRSQTRDIEQYIRSDCDKSPPRWVDFFSFETFLMQIIKGGALSPENISDIDRFLKNKKLNDKVEGDIMLVNKIFQHYEEVFRGLYLDIDQCYIRTQDIVNSINKLTQKIQEDESSVEATQSEMAAASSADRGFFSGLSLSVKAAGLASKQKKIVENKQLLKQNQEEQINLREQGVQLFKKLCNFLNNYHKVFQILTWHGLNPLDEYSSGLTFKNFFDNCNKQYFLLNFKDHETEAYNCIEIIENMHDVFNRCFIFDVALKSNVFLLRRVLNSNPSLISYCHSKYGNLFLYACRHSTLEFLEEVFRLQSSDDLNDNIKYVLHYAIHNKDEKVFYWIFEKFPSLIEYLNVCDQNQRSILDMALLYERWDVAIFLLEKGACSGSVPLVGHNIVKKCMLSGRIGLLFTLLNRNLRILPDTSCAVKALVVADYIDATLYVVKLKIIEELISKGANVNHYYDGKPLIFWAVEYKQPQVVQCFVNNGADVNLRTISSCQKEMKGMTSMHLAVKNGDKACIHALLCSPVLDLSIKTKRKMGPNFFPKGSTISHWVDACSDEHIKRLVSQKSLTLKPNYRIVASNFFAESKSATASAIEAIRCDCEASVVFNNQSLSKAEINDLCESLFVNKSLLSLRMSDLYLDDDDLAALVKAIANHSSLNVLCLEKNNFSSNAIPFIVKLIEDSSSLSTLIISFQQLSDQDRQILYEVIYCSSVKFCKFDLCGSGGSYQVKINNFLHRRVEKSYAFFNAIRNNDLLFVKDVLSQNRFVDVYVDGITPLHYAVSMRNEVVVELLLPYYCSLNCADKKGKTPLELAQQNEDQSIIELLDPSLSGSVLLITFDSINVGYSVDKLVPQKIAEKPPTKQLAMFASPKEARVHSMFHTAPVVQGNRDFPIGLPSSQSPGVSQGKNFKKS